MKSEKLVVGFPLAKSLPLDDKNLASYPAEGGDLISFSETFLRPNHAEGIRNKCSSSYNRNHDEDAMKGNDSSSDSASETSSEDEISLEENEQDGKPNIIEKYAVMNPGEDEATSTHQFPAALRRLGKELESQTTSPADLVPVTSNDLVIPTGDILDDFNNNSSWVEGFMHMFPEGCGGSICPTRTRSISLKEWIRILLQRGDDTWRKDRAFLFCASAITFRHEAITNVRFKLSTRLIASNIAKICSIRADHVISMADAYATGGKSNAILNANPETSTLLRTMQAVSANATWTDHGKHGTRMQAISMMIQFGQPFFGLHSTLLMLIVRS